jgi:hypothetical protein
VNLEDRLMVEERQSLDRFVSAFAREFIIGDFDRARVWASLAEVVIEDSGLRQIQASDEPRL